MTMTQMAEMSTGEMTKEVLDDLRRLYHQIGADLARVEVGLSQT
ncbi:hypothetical protein BAJUN_02660 [Bajunvirus bajun]|uniref:Uncharacterized protein n=1 Tax=Brevundimonas phage vB_BgoS-Bajun TaxID=2948594 RepID=A0A9E7SUX2_9CAUD|nr:hypothetical protein BAJUN_02660 [Brevundimonas phage vB_BgoS-Bajun]